MKQISKSQLDQLLSRTFLDADPGSQSDNEMIRLVGENYLLKTSALTFPLRYLVAAGGALVLILLCVVHFSDKNEQFVSPLFVSERASFVPLIADSAEQEDNLKKRKLVRARRGENKDSVMTVKSQDVRVTVPKGTNSDSLSVENRQVLTLESNKTVMNDLEKFPDLTESEIKANEKEKKKMIKLAAKTNRKKYAQLNYNNTTFYIQTAEVSNLEYRTFLFDLLIQGKKEEFLKAKPDQGLWVNAAGISKFSYLKDKYFSDKYFDNYPVVNISKEGADMYCKWFSELLAAVSDKNDKVNFCRLPEETEWIYAAKGGSSQAVYPWNTDSIQNSKNRFLANFCFQKMQEKFRKPIVYLTPVSVSAYTTAGMALNNDSIASANVYTYNPNPYGLYCMSGNASEMVYDKNSRQIKCKGGSWASDFEHLKIDAQEESWGVPSPMVGFRVVLIKK